MRIRHASLASVAGVVLLAALLTACEPTSLSVKATPTLFPTFSSSIVDYVNRCDPSTATNVEVEAPANTTVSVAGSPAQSGRFSVPVSQQVGTRFTIVVTVDGRPKTHHVRCLPTDFPNWTAQRSGPPQAAFYAAQLFQDINTTSYSAIFDTNGVPVWWSRQKSRAFLMTPLSNKNLAVAFIAGGMEERNLNGEVVRSLNTFGAPSDSHDVLLLPNGNYVMATVQPVACDLSTWGLVGEKVCLNHVFQELTPLGVPVWQWDTSAHIPPTETTAPWIDSELNESGPFADPNTYDPWHYNSVEFTGDGFIISFRHLDAVYKIDKATGNIVWKLSGTPRPESLEIVDDPLDGTRGQHDARLLADGTVTIYDNGSMGRSPGRPPRNVGYFVDTEFGTATLVQDLRDATIGGSGCCGSSRTLPRGNVVTGWGGTNQVSERRQDGTVVLRLGGWFVYRAVPILPGQFSASQFRAGMDAQYAT